MKKLFTLLLLASCYAGIAQTKPSKEETISFINKTLQMSLGYATYGTRDHGRATEKVISNYSFSGDRISYTVDEKDLSDNSLSVVVNQIYNLNWATFSDLSSEKDSLSSDPEIECIRIVFTGKVFFKDNRMDNYQVRSDAWLIALRSKASLLT